MNHVESVNYAAQHVDREFARIARRLPGGVCLYDLLMGYWERTADRALVAGLPPLPSGATVLELGVGTGFLTRLLASRYPDARIVGLDLSDEMLGVTRRALSRRPPRDAHRRRGPAPAAPPSGTLSLRRHDVVRDGLGRADCVVSSFLLDLLDERDLLVVLTRIQSALRPGGSAHLLTLTSEHGRRWQRLRAPRRLWYDSTVAGYFACYRSRQLRRLSHRLLDYYTHCRPIPLRRIIVDSGLFRVRRHRLSAVTVAGIPLLPAQIIEVVPR